MSPPIRLSQESRRELSGKLIEDCVLVANDVHVRDFLKILKECTMKPNRTFAFLVVIACVVSLLGSGSAIAGNTTFKSADFNGKNLDRSVWTLVNPRNDGGVGLANKNTDNAALWLTVPKGIDHDIWTSGDNALKIMQTAADEPFNLEAKWLSPLSGGTSESYQAQGVFVSDGSSSNMLFGFTTGTTDSIYAYAATFIGGYGSPSIKAFKKVAPLGAGPMWLRLTRSGNDWTFLYSFNGTTWDNATTFTEAFGVAKLGPFSLNAGSSPAEFTSKVDYFFNMDSIAAPDDSLPAAEDVDPPYIHSVRVKYVSANAMMVAWNTDELSDGLIQYGLTTSYGQQNLDLDLAYSHVLTCTGLTPGSTINFRIMAGDSAEHVSTTTNFTTSTDAIVVDGSSRSDDFLGATLDGTIWSLTDPVGDVTAGATGEELSIALPAGSAHDLWSDGDRMPRLVQSLGSQNSRQFVVKFNTGVNGSATLFEAEGLLFEESSSKFMRFDFVNNASETRAFCAAFYGGYASPASRFNVSVGALGSAPLYMRVTQYGSYWTMEYSTNGSSWTTAGTTWEFIEPTKVGISSANVASSGSAPAFTSLVDWFQGIMPAQAKLVGPAMGTTGLETFVTLSWRATIAASGYHLQVAKDSLFSVIVVNDSSLTSLTKDVTGLQNATTYYWRVKGLNAKGSGAYSAAWTFTTKEGTPGQPNLLAPANNAVNQPVDVTLRWNHILGPISYFVQVGTDTSLTLGLVVSDSSSADSMRTVTGLAQNTKYYWRVRGKNVGGIGPFSPVYNFTTIVPVPGQVVLVSPATNSVANKDTLKLTWRKASPSVNRYWLIYAPDSLFQMSASDSSITDTTSVLRSLLNNTRYFWKVAAGNPAGWGSFSEVRAFNTLITSVPMVRELPKDFVLSQNYPNPFNPATRIEFGLPSSGQVLLEVYNMLGSKVATLVNGVRSAGYHEVTFDGAGLASGIYFYRLATDNTVLLKKMALVK
jgi:hypothetical protein